MLIISIVSSIILLIGFSWYGFKNSETESAYLLADRETKLFPLIATLVMTELNPSTLIAFSGAAYFAGVWALSLPFVFLFGLGFYTFSVAKKWKEWDGYSVAEVFSRTYGKTMGRLASLLLIVSMIGFSATYIKAMYLFFSPIFGKISEWSLTFLLTSTILVLNWKGGLRSIIRMDVLSFIAVALLLPLIFLTVYFKQDGQGVHFFNYTSVSNGMAVLPLPYVFSLILLTMFTYIAAPWYGQKIVSSKSKETAKLGVGISSILVFLLYCFPILSVLIFKSNLQELSSGQEAFPLLVQFALPDFLKGFAYVVFFAIGSTTLSGVWSAQTTMLIGDFINPNHNQSTSDRSRLSMIAFAFCSYLGANLLVDQVLDKLILANIPIFALSFSLLAGFYWKKVSSAGAYSSTIVGTAWGIFCYLYFGEKEIYTLYWSVGGLPLVFGTGIIFSYLLPIRKSKKY